MAVPPQSSLSYLPVMFLILGLYFSADHFVLSNHVLLSWRVIILTWKDLTFIKVVWSPSKGSAVQSEHLLGFKYKMSTMGLYF